jgi:hypothetical protein
MYARIMLRIDTKSQDAAINVPALSPKPKTGAYQGGELPAALDSDYYAIWMRIPCRNNLEVLRFFFVASSWTRTTAPPKQLEPFKGFPSVPHPSHNPAQTQLRNVLL